MLEGGKHVKEKLKDLPKAYKDQTFEEHSGQKG